MAKQVSVTIVGPGSMGTALAKALPDAGVRVDEIVYRSAQSGRSAKKLAREVGAKAVKFEAWLEQLRRSASPGRAWKPVPTLNDAVPTNAKETKNVPATKGFPTLVWLCVGDSAIATTAFAMAQSGEWKGTTVFHSSGALSSDELEPLRQAGAKVASVHPMMTFVRSSVPSMRGVSFALEGDRSALGLARTFVRRLGGESFVISKEDKPLYHALGAFVSPLIIAQMATVERIGRELSLKPQQTRRIVAPILRQTIRNYVEHGSGAAFSGPIVRGDVATVKKHLEALKRVRGAEAIYRALARVAVEELPSKDAAAIKKVIGEPEQLDI